MVTLYYVSASRTNAIEETVLTSSSTGSPSCFVFDDCTGNHKESMAQSLTDTANVRLSLCWFEKRLM